MKDLIDNGEINELMEKLENLDDEELAVQLLKELNEKTKNLGTLVMNRDSSIDHSEWENMCLDAKKEVDLIVKRIRDL